jgi:hypothetical protein
MVLSFMPHQEQIQKGLDLDADEEEDWFYKLKLLNKLIIYYDWRIKKGVRRN